ncbi:Mu transposase C-terminal domain-containing protein [Azospirillum argentinense]
MPQLLTLSAGAAAWLNETPVTIVSQAGVDSVVVVLPDGASRTVAVADLSATAPAETAGDSDMDLAIIAQEDWDLAVRRERVVKALAETPKRSRAMVAEGAAALGVTTNMVYRLIARYLEDPRTTTLLPRKRGKPTGLEMLDAPVERIVTATITEMAFMRPKRTGDAIHLEIRRRCIGAGLKPPGRTTVYRRLATLPRKDVVRAQDGAKAARDKFAPVLGTFPITSWPLEVVQIDHTVVDLILVDEFHRRPIGRPFLTLAVDVHTRMVVGFLLSLDPPSATSVGLCLTHAVAPKDNWLERMRVGMKWPVWGIPDTVHVDNGKEFHSEALRRGCSQHGITIDYRPVRTPHYGGHIERLIGTMMGDVHFLPGTTFSNVSAKGNYDAEKSAVMTLAETQEWLTLNVCVYHNQRHSALGMTPLAAWERGILGTPERPGRGLPARVTNPERFLIDFLPLARREVTGDGVRLFNIHYWSDALRPLIGQSRRFVVRYDPRDMSRIWLLSTDNEYYPLGYKARHRPVISLWEHREVSRQLRAEGARTMDEAAIFEGVERMRAVVAAATAKSKRARRQAERSRQHRTLAQVEKAPSADKPAGEETVVAPPRPFEVEDW